MARHFAALDRDRDQMLSKAGLPDDLTEHSGDWMSTATVSRTFLEVMTAKTEDFSAPTATATAASPSTSSSCSTSSREEVDGGANR